MRIPFTVSAGATAIFIALGLVAQAATNDTNALGYHCNVDVTPTHATPGRQ